MVVLFGLLSMLAFFMVFIVLLVPRLGFVSSRKQGLKVYGSSFLALFVLAAVFTEPTDDSASGENDSNNENEDNQEENEGENEENNENNENESNNENEEEQPEQISYELISHEYNSEEETYDVEIETDFPDGTELYVTLQEIEDEPFELDGYTNNGKIQLYEVEDGEINASIPAQDDAWDGPMPIANGEWILNSSFTVGEDEEEYNPHLYEEYGDYDSFVDNYSIDGTPEETDNGYVVEDLAQQRIEIDDAHSAEEINEMKDEFFKENSEEIPFGELEKNPDDLFGEFVTYSGEVLEITEDGDYTILRLGLDDWADEVLWVEYEGRIDAISGDNITIYGEVQGSHTYESQAGWQITVPLIMAEVIEED